MVELTSESLGRLLGMPRRNPPSWHVQRSVRDAEFEIVTGSIAAGDRSIPGTLLRPDNPNGAAVLYCHAHGHRYDIGRAELLDGRPAIAEPLGPEIARLGFTVLCIDMPGFGDRRHEGEEAALAKAALWRGSTMMGLMLSDLMNAVDLLSELDHVEVGRIGAFGMSMGATHAYWLAALDRRVAAVAHACAFANMAPLIEQGAHNQHEIYMTVPRLLTKCDMGDVAALIAPRPQLILAGALDPLTPASCLDPAVATVHRAYEGSSALSIHVEGDAGHELTAGMRAAVLEFLTGRLHSGLPAKTVREL